MAGVLFVIMVGGWEGAVRLFDVPEYILPAPSAIALSFRGEWGELLRHARPTLYEAVLGYIIGNSTALLAAALMAEFRAVEIAAYPYIIGLRSLPIVSVAPLLIIWFGFTIWPIAAAAALICFFPTLVNGVDGFKSIDRTTLELMRGLNASRWQTFRHVKFPNALPYIFAALKIAVGSAMVGAVVGEWIASSEGLGFLTILANNYVDTLLLFRAVLMIGLVSVVWFALVMLLEAHFLRWQRKATG